MRTSTYSATSLRRAAGGTAAIFREVALRLLLTVALAIGHISSPPPSHAQDRPTDRLPDRPGQGVQLKAINVGFVRHAYGAWMTKVADGGFETSTGRSVHWQPYDTDSAVVAALAGGRVDIGLMGTSVVAAAIARGLDLKIFYVFGGSADSECMAIDAEGSAYIDDPRTLQSKVIAVPFGSTAHFRLLQSLKRWELNPGTMRIVNLQTTQIVQAWKRKEIDAAVVSEPTLAQLEKRGRIVPLPAPAGHTGLLVLAAAADFLSRHVVFLSRLIDVMVRADQAFVHDAVPVSADRPDINSMAFVSGLSPQELITSIKRYRAPGLGDQVTATWLGGGAASGLLAELKSNVEVWRWAGRLAGPEPDYMAAISPEPAQLALSYRR